MQYALEVLRFKERELQNIIFTMRENYKRKIKSHTGDDYQEVLEELEDVQKAIKLIYGTIKKDKEDTKKRMNGIREEVNKKMREHREKKAVTKPILPSDCDPPYDKVYVSTETPKVTLDSPKGHPEELIILKDVRL